MRALNYRTVARQPGARGASQFAARGVARAPAGELKFLDLDVNDGAVAAQGTIVSGSLPTIAQGVTESTRVGRKCTITSINCRYLFNLGLSSVLLSAETVRMILVLDKQCNGAAPAILDVLESDNFQSFNNLANKGRFRTLLDRTVDINPSAAAGDGTTNDTAGNHVSGDFFIKCKIPIEYDTTASTGVVSTIRSNNLVFILLGENGGVVSFDSKWRLRYTD